MTLLQSRKSKRRLTSIWDIAVRSVTGTGGVRSGIFSPELTGKLENLGFVPGTFHFWKRHGWRFIPVHTHYLIPTGKRPGSGYPIIVLAIDSTRLNGDWLSHANRLCQEGALVIAVELPKVTASVSRQAEILMEATWTALSVKIGGLAGIPVHLTWWGTDEAAAVVEQAARWSEHKYFLPPTRVETGAFKLPDPPAPASDHSVRLFLVQA